ANMVCFTTGRGSVFGCKPVPSLKLATNSTMYRHIEEDMDVNCGEVLDGGKSIQEMGEQIFQLILDTASGKPSKSEAQGFGDNEFLPWQMGAVM
ncbi:MAG: UxaA family hydrolase, partial [SAR324 cluster bacterium]|nr:UxaA family hydrolase [SAR324 cluster bacterium]